MRILIEHETMNDLIENILERFAPKEFALNADKGDDCMPYAELYDEVEYMMNYHGIYDKDYEEVRNDTMMKSMMDEIIEYMEIDDLVYLFNQYVYFAMQDSIADEYYENNKMTKETVAILSDTKLKSIFDCLFGYDNKKKMYDKIIDWAKTADVLEKEE